MLRGHVQRRLLHSPTAARQPDTFQSTGLSNHLSLHCRDDRHSCPSRLHASDDSFTTTPLLSRRATFNMAARQPQLPPERSRLMSYTAPNSRPTLQQNPFVDLYTPDGADIVFGSMNDVGSFIPITRPLRGC